MHELGIADAIIKMMDKILKEEEMTGANKIVLEIGELSGVVPKFMDDCWGAVVAGTKYENTALEMEIVPGIARCLDCGSDFRAAETDFKCPECGSEKVMPMFGRDMTIKEIEAY